MGKMILRISSIPKRFHITGLLFVCDLLSGYLFASLSIVVADVTSPRRIIRNNETETIEAEFNWTSTEVGLMLGINPIGSVLTCLFGSFIHRTGGVICYAIGKIGEAILSLLFPLMMDIHVYCFIASRLIFGFFEGLSYIGLIDIFARWAPPDERVRLSNFAYLGYGVGIAINYPLSGYIIQNFGWRFLFYMYGVAVSIWCFIWIIFVSTDPSTDKFITEKEKNYLMNRINYICKNKTKIPYKSIFTSIPVYALLNEFFISTFTLSFMTLLPLYVKDVYDANIQTVALISGIPELSSLVLRPLFACFTDFIRSKPNGCSVGKIHKLILFWGQSFTVMFFFLSSIWNNVICCVVCLTLARISFGLSQVSYTVIVIDVGGQYSGFLQSIAVAVKNICFFLNPVIIGLLIQNHTQSEWNVYFILISFLTMYGVVVFMIFGSGDLQPWAKVRESSDESDKPENFGS